MSVRADGDSSAVVETVAWNALQKHVCFLPGAAIEPCLDYLAGQARTGPVGVVEVRKSARPEVFGKRHPEKTASTVMHDRIRSADRVAPKSATFDHDDMPGCFGHDDQLAGSTDAPRVRQVIRHDLHPPVFCRHS